MASTTRSSPSLLSRMLGAKPPSSPTLHASWPYLPLITLFRLWYTSEPIFIACTRHTRLGLPPHHERGWQEATA